MHETWLRPNRRAMFFGCVPPLVMAGMGAWLAFGVGDSTRSIWRWVGIVIIAASLPAIALFLNQLRLPRIAFQNGEVLFYLRGRRPISVPVEIVESFFFGQGPAHLPAVSKQPNTVNLIARLSQRHTEWASQNVQPALGKWAEGYVTIRGTWCQPLSQDLIRTLNKRLKEVKDELQATGGK